MLQSLLDATDKLVRNYVVETWLHINQQANGLFTALAILFIVITGYLVLTGRLQISLSTLFPRFFKFLIVWGLVTNVGILTDYAFDLFTNGPSALASTLIYASPAGAEQGGVNGAVDQLWAQGLAASSAILQRGSVMTWLPFFFAATVFAATVAVVLYVTFLLMLSKLAVAVLLASAPLFVILYLFDFSKSLFEGWLRQLLTFALVPVYLYSLLGLLLSIAMVTSNDMLRAATVDSPSLTQLGPYVLVMLVTLLLLKQVPGWAAGTAGGVGLTDAGASSTVRGAASKGAGWLQRKLKGYRAPTETDGVGPSNGASRGSGVSGSLSYKAPRRDNWSDIPGSDTVSYSGKGHSRGGRPAQSRSVTSIATRPAEPFQLELPGVNDGPRQLELPGISGDHPGASSEEGS